MLPCPIAAVFQFLCSRLLVVGWSVVPNKGCQALEGFPQKGLIVCALTITDCCFFHSRCCFYLQDKETPLIINDHVTSCRRLRILLHRLLLAVVRWHLLLLSSRDMDNGGQGGLGQRDASIFDKDNNGGSARIIEDEPHSNLLSFSSSVAPACFNNIRHHRCPRHTCHCLCSQKGACHCHCPWQGCPPQGTHCHCHH